MQGVKVRLIRGIYIFLAVISAAGLRCDLRSEQELLNDYEMEFTGTRRFLLCFTRSFSKDRVVGFCLVAAILFLFALVVKVYRKQEVSKKRIALITLLAVFFGTVQVMCRHLRYGHTLDPMFETPFMAFRTVCIFISYAVICFLLVFLLFTRIDMFHQDLDEKRLAAEAETTAGSSTFKTIISTILLVVLWIPYLILFYPGVCNIDTTDMIIQALGHKTSITALTAVTGPEITMTNHHPFFDTVIFSSFYRLGKDVIGNVDVGVFLYGLMMLVLFALAFSLFWNFLRPKTAGMEGPLRVCFWFTALFPLFSIYSFSMLKDTLFSFACFLYTILLIVAADRAAERFADLRFCMGMIVAGVLLTLTKNQGAYVLLLTYFFALVLLLIDQMKRKQLMSGRLWIRFSACFLLPVVFFIFIWSKILLPMWNVAPGGKQEGIGFMFQQTAACLKEHGDDVTQEEKKAIAAILPYDDLTELYNPEIHDPVKYKYKQTATEEEVKAYYRAWLSLGRRHPKTYAVALLNSCYGYFYISESGGFTYTTFKRYKDKISLHVFNAFVGEEKDKITSISALQEALNSVPLVNLLVGLSVPTWLVLLCVTYFLDRGNMRGLIGTLIGFISIGVFVLCPDNSNGRYVMPFYYMLVALAGSVLYLCS